MSYFKVIVPVQAVNLILNPICGAADPDTSFDIAGDGAGSPDVTRSTADALFGDGSFLFALSTSAYVRLYQATAVTVSSYTLSAYVKRSAGGVLTASHAVLYFDSADVTPTTISLIRDGWYYLEYTGTATNGTRNFGVKALENGLKADGIQLENTAYATTLIHGDIEGFRSDGYNWTGTAHASISTRHAQERSGGRVKDMWTDLLANIRSFVGGGEMDDTIVTTALAAGPGAIFQNNIIQPRTIDLGISFNSSTIGNLHTRRNTLLEAIKSRLVTPIQPFVFRYTGNAEPLEINARYAGGLELTRLQKTIEQTGMRMFCENPFWRSIGNDASQLDVQDTLTTNYIAQRSALGEWSNLATTLNAVTRALVKTTDGNLYIGGDSTAPGSYVQLWNGATLAALGSNPGNTVNALLSDGTNVYAGGADNNLEKWDGATWANVGITQTTSEPLLDALVRAVATSNGNLFIGGDFTTVAGDTNGNGVARYNTLTGDWTMLTTGVAGGVIYAIAIYGNDIYVGGTFTSAGGVASTSKIAKWNILTSAWSSVTSGLSGATSIRALAFDSSGNLYIGGDFTNIGDANGDYILKWNGSTLSSLGTGLNDVCHGLATSGTNVYLVGSFSLAGGVASTSRVALWNGSVFSPLGTGANNNSALAIAISGSDIYVGGSFTLMGGVANAVRIARWDGAVWNPLSTGIGGGQVNGIAISGTDVYIAGTFIDLVDANGDGITKWNGSAFSSLSTGITSLGNCVGIIGTDVYIGGSFTNIGTANGDYIIRFDGAAFNDDAQSLASLTVNAAINALVKDTSGNIYIGGGFTSPTNYIIGYGADGSDFFNLSISGLNGVVYTLAIDGSDNLYIGGAFTLHGSITLNYVAKWTSAGGIVALASGVSGTVRAIAINPTNNNVWVAGDSGLLAYYNGTKWTVITTSTTATIYALTFDEDGQLFIGGAFATIGGVSAEGVTKLYPANSSGLFFQLDVDLPSTPTVYAILIDGDEITLGFSTAGSAVSPGTTTITNNGTANAYPVVKVTGPGTVRELTNVTTGKTIQFSGLTLGGTETMTLDLRLFKKTLKSNLRPALNSKIQQSDLDEWSLQPGANSVNLLITDSSATGSMTWELLHESVDGGV